METSTKLNSLNSTPSTPKNGTLYLASSLRDGIEDFNLQQLTTLLEEKGADPNVLMPLHGVTPFHLVIGIESQDFAEEVTKLFLRHKADPNVRSVDGMTPVHVAAAWGRCNILELLLANGGNPSSLDDDNCSPLHYAHQGDHQKAVSLLEKYCTFEKNDNDDAIKYKLELDKVLVNNGEILAEYIASDHPVMEKSFEIPSSINLTAHTSDYNPDNFSKDYTSVNFDMSGTKECRRRKPIDVLNDLQLNSSDNRSALKPRDCNESILDHMISQLSSSYSKNSSNSSKTLFGSRKSSEKSLDITCPKRRKQIKMIFNRPKRNHENKYFNDLISLKDNSTLNVIKEMGKKLPKRSQTDYDKCFDETIISKSPNLMFYTDVERKRKSLNNSKFERNLSPKKIFLTPSSKSSKTINYSGSRPKKFFISPNQSHSSKKSELQNSTIFNRSDRLNSSSENQKSAELNLNIRSDHSLSCNDEVQMDENFNQTESGKSPNKSDLQLMSGIGILDSKTGVDLVENSDLEYYDSVTCFEGSNLSDASISTASFLSIPKSDNNDSEKENSCMASGDNNITEDKTHIGRSLSIMTNDLTPKNKRLDSDSLISIDEEYRYQDLEHGIQFLERRLCVSPSCASSDINMSFYSCSTMKSEPLPIEILRLDNLTLRERLVNLGENPGPITQTTQHLYLKRLHKLESKIKPNQRKNSDAVPINNDKNLLKSSILSIEWIKNIDNFISLEQKVFEEFSQSNPTRKWREGNSKNSFNYLLLDPRITKDLPRRSATLSLAEKWEIFLSAIFYVGKGKRSRPYAHLYDAFKVWISKNDQGSDVKTQKILDIWNSQQGVVVLQVFQNTIPVEAYTREAAIIEALSTQKLSNRKCGEYYGIVATWRSKEKFEFGRYLLFKAMQIFLIEGERQIFPNNL